MFDDAKNMYEIRQKHLSLLGETIENLKKEHKSLERDLKDLPISFRSFQYNGIWEANGPDELRVYWLNFILEQYYYNDLEQNSTSEDGIKKILDNIFNIYYIKAFDRRHFNDFNSKFIIYKGGMWDCDSLIVMVPFYLNYFQILFVIQVIEGLTEYEVSKISLGYWYNKRDYLLLHEDFLLALDNSVNKFEGHPFISKREFLEIEISSHENWHMEISEFKNYVEQIDKNIFECNSCGERFYDVGDGAKSWYCLNCQHNIDRKGNFV